MTTFEPGSAHQRVIPTDQRASAMNDETAASAFDFEKIAMESAGRKVVGA
jgi:hypothetical protein